MLSLNHKGHLCTFDHGEVGSKWRTENKLEARYTPDEVEMGNGSNREISATLRNILRWKKCKKTPNQQGGRR